MTMVQQSAGGSRGSATGLADVIDTILDKGLVLDAFVRVSLVGIELLTIDVRVVIASVDTYLRFAEACNRLDLTGDKEGLPGLVGNMEEGGAKHKTKGALEAAGDKLRDFAADDETAGGGRQRQKTRREGD